jgi:ATP-dependent Lhr-like helicase
MRRGFEISRSDLGVLVAGGEHVVEDILDALVDAGSEEPPTSDLLLEGAAHLQREKWDWALPQSLLNKTFASQHLDVDEALDWMRAL